MKQVFAELTNSDNTRSKVVDNKKTNRKTKPFSGLNPYISDRVLKIAAGETDVEPTSLRIIAKRAGAPETVCLRALVHHIYELEDTVARLRARVVFGAERIAA